MIILVDAMGGDNAPDAVIKGAVKAAKEIDGEIKQYFSEFNNIFQIPDFAPTHRLFKIKFLFTFLIFLINFSFFSLL